MLLRLPGASLLSCGKMGGGEGFGDGREDLGEVSSQGVIEVSNKTCKFMESLCAPSYVRAKGINKYAYDVHGICRSKNLLEKKSLC